MKNKAQKVLSRLYATALILLAALLLIASMCPIITVDTSDLEYVSGRFTEEAMLMEHADFGIKWVVTLIAEFDDFSTVFGIEQDELRLKNIPDEIEEAREKIRNYVANYDDADTPVENTRRYKELEEDLNDLLKEQEDVEKDLEERLAKLTDADVERIRDKMQNDPDFVSLFACIKAVAFSVLVQEEQSDDPMDAISYLISMLLFVGVILFGFLFPLITAIIFLVKLIQYFVNLGKADIDKTEKRMNGFPFVVYPVVMATLLMFFVFTSNIHSIMAGSSLYLTALVWLVSILVRAIKAIVMAEKNRARMIVKQVLSLLSAIVVIVMFLNFNGMFMMEDIRENSELMSSAYRAALQEQGVASAEALDKAETAALVFEIVFAMIIPSFVILMIAEVVALFTRFRYKTTKTKNGVSDLNTTHLVMAIILTVIVIVPVIFNAPTYDAKVEAFEKGMFKTCYTEYEESGTLANFYYESLKQQQELGAEIVEAMKQEIESAPAEALEEMNLELHKAERELEQVEQEIKDIETRKSKSVTCIVMGGLFILIEILYIVIPKLIKVKNDNPEEVPAEEAPTEEVPTEEVPAEEVPTEEAPADETSAEPAQE